MKQITFIFLLTLLPLTASAATLIDGIYYNFSETRATVTSGDTKYSGSVAIPTTVMYTDIGDNTQQRDNYRRKCFLWLLWPNIGDNTQQRDINRNPVFLWLLWPDIGDNTQQRDIDWKWCLFWYSMVK